MVTWHTNETIHIGHNVHSLPSQRLRSTMGLIFTAGSIYRVLHALNIPIHIQEVLTIGYKPRPGSLAAQLAGLCQPDGKD
eukprot:1069397-Pelagomonas_calceolata.AAC.7